MEDTATGEAFASNAQHNYVLRILSGPHQGAEIPLQETPTTIGKGDASDVVLMDGEMQEQHVQVLVRGNQCVCIPLNGAKVFVAGGMVNAETALNDFAPIVCGTTLMAVGPKNVAWPTIEMPDMDTSAESPEVQAQEEAAPQTPENPQEKPETPPEKAEEPKAAPSMDKSAEPPAAETTPAPATQEGKNVIPPTPTPTPPKRSKKKLIILLASVLLGIFMLSGAYFFLGSKTPPEDDPSLEAAKFPIVTLKKSIEDVLQKLAVDPEHTSITLSGQKFILKCYVKTAQEQIDLQKALKALPRVVFQTMRIYVQNILIDQAQALLSQYTLYVKPGKKLDTILLTGYLYSIEQLSAIKTRILKDVPGINGIETTLLSPDEIYNVASNVLVQYDLMGLLKIQPVRNGLMISGHIQASQEPRWLLAQKALKQNFQGICKVLMYVAIVAPQAVKNIFFPSPITGVSLPENDKPWIDLKNGDRYYEGALLPSSYYIQSISQEGIRLHKNDDSVFFTLSEL